MTGDATYVSRTVRVRDGDKGAAAQGMEGKRLRYADLIA